MNANLIESPISKLLTNSYLPYELHPIHYKNCWCLPHLGRIPKEHARLKDDFGLDAKRGDFSGVQSWVCRCKTSWNMTWGTAKWLQTSMLDFYRKLIMVVSRIRYHMVDTCCLSVISFRLQTKDTIEKTGCEGEAMWSSWTHTVLAFLFTFHDVKWSLGTVMTKSSKFVTATTTWNWKNWKNWNNNILYTLETSSTNFTLDLVQISLISTLPLGQLKVCFFGAKTNKGQTNHDTIILY